MGNLQLKGSLLCVLSPMSHTFAKMLIGEDSADQFAIRILRIPLSKAAPGSRNRRKSCWFLKFRIQCIRLTSNPGQRHSESRALLCGSAKRHR